MLFKSSDGQATATRTVPLGTELEVNVNILGKAVAGATVEVVASRETVYTANTISAEVGVNITADSLQQLPVMNRNVVSAAIMAPGVSLVSGSSVDPTKKASTYMTTGEGQGRGTNFALDGADNNSTDVGGYVSSIPMDAVGEFQVVTNQYKAEFGRSNAGFLSVVSKAGGNTFEGIVSGQYTNQSLRARSTDEGSKKDSKQMSYSATVAGPIINDKLFYMISAEQKTDSSVPYTFNPRAIALWPELGSVMSEMKSETVYTRFDWQASNTLLATLTLGYDHNKTPKQTFSGTSAANGVVDPGFMGTGENKIKRYGLKIVATLTNAMTWESNLMNFDYNNSIRPYEPNYHGGTNMTILERAGAAPYNTPTSLLGRTGDDPNNYQNTGINRTQWRNDLTWIMGNHSVKGGLDLQKYKYAEAVNFRPETNIRTWYISGTPFGPGYWAQGLPLDRVVAVRFSQRGSTPPDEVKQYGLYLQDDWTIGPKLSVYAGLRADKDTAFEFMSGLGTLYSQIAAANPQLLHGSTPPKDKTYVSPRIQFVYKPKGDDKEIYKIGAGRFVANVIDNITGFSRALLAPLNGMPGTVFSSQAACTATGATALAGTVIPGLFAAGTTFPGADVNGHPIVLPADLTPYNYVNNVNGLRDYFRNTLNGYLLPASFSTKGKSLMASDFTYPTTDTLSLSGYWQLADRHSLEVTYLWTRTKNLTVQYTTDGSASPLAKSIGPTGGEMGDTIFLSNQSSRTHSLGFKYMYVGEKMNAIFNFLCRNNRDSSGNTRRAFDNSGNADFYGPGVNIPYVSGAEVTTQGSNDFEGSFQVSWKAPAGIMASTLGTWHSGKYYDLFLGYNAQRGVGQSLNLGQPSTRLGSGKGDWAMDVGLMVSRPTRFGKKMTFDPFIKISNLLNNYDYGSNYQGNIMNLQGAYQADFMQRRAGWQANSPRQAAFGFRFAF